MTARQTPLDPIREWGYLQIGSTPGPNQVTEAEAEALLDAAAAHPLAKDEGSNILVRHRRSRLRAQQMVGVIAAPGCSLEILPKVDPDLADNAADGQSLRRQLAEMLDVAYDLGVSVGGMAAMSREANSLLEIFIRRFSESLLQQTRRGLPREYVSQQDDLPRLRGRLDVMRQFSHNAVRPDRLACRFDEMTSDIALMQIMKATVRVLGRYARSPAVKRMLAELSFIFADITHVSDIRPLWRQVRIDRTNNHWKQLLELAALLMGRDWQGVSSAAKAPEGISLLFPMNDLFELYVEKLLRRALAGSDIEVIGQGGYQYCLGDWIDDATPVTANAFRTKPDIILKRRGRIVGVIDTKWKRLPDEFTDRRKGVQQGDVYQLMAYARVYWPQVHAVASQHVLERNWPRLMLLYPAISRQTEGVAHRFGVHSGLEMIALGRVDISKPKMGVQRRLKDLAHFLTDSAASI